MNLWRLYLVASAQDLHRHLQHQLKRLKIKQKWRFLFRCCFRFPSWFLGWALASAAQPWRLSTGTLRLRWKTWKSTGSTGSEWPRRQPARQSCKTSAGTWREPPLCCWTNEQYKTTYKYTRLRVWVTDRRHYPFLFNTSHFGIIETATLLTLNLSPLFT